jgi:uncharacterized SAM-binding protein YcdF (DUF218 family)
MTVHNWKRRVAVAALVMVAATLVLPQVARSLGRWLIIEDAPQKSRAIVVLGGHLPFRALEAAEIYRAGWAPELWLTQGRRSVEEIALERLNVSETSEAEYSRQVLEQQGVPSSAIQILRERNRDTADEVRNVARRLRDAGGGRVIFVTSKFHTRRLIMLWRLLATNEGEALVRYTPDDLFDPDRWWHTTGDAMAVAREYGSMLNAWAGFPISSDR